MYKYVNPGYRGLFDNPDIISQNNDNRFNPINGVYLTISTQDYILTFPDGIKEMWIKFMAYFDAVTRLYIDKDNVTGFKFNSTNTITLWNRNGSIDITGLNSYFRSTKMFVMHIKSDETNGILEGFLNDSLIGRVTGNVYDGKDIKHLEIQGDYGWTRVSNFIIADYDISKENVILLPTTKVVADGFTASGINYSTQEAGASLTKKIDTAALTTKLGDLNKLSVNSVFMAVPTAYAFNKELDNVEASVKTADGEATLDTKNLINSTVSVLNGVLFDPILENPVTKAPWKANDLTSLEVKVKTKE